MRTLAERLIEAREDKGWTKADLRRAAKLKSPSTLTELESGSRTESPQLPVIADALGVEVLWLQHEKGVKKRAVQHLVSPGESRLPIRRALFKLSAGVSGYEVEYENGESEPIFMAKRWFEQNHYNPERLVALKVNGRSMEPKMHDGDLVIVNTESTVPKDGIVFAVNYEGEMVIKRMKRDAGQWFISSDNPDKVRYGDKICAEACFMLGEAVYLQTETI